RKTSIRLRHNSDTVGLLQTGCAALDHIQRRFAQKARTVFPRGFLDFPYRFLGYDQFPDFIIEQQYFGNGVTPPVAAAAALAAAFADTESEGFGAFAVDTGFRDQFIAWTFVNSTMWTQQAHQPLRRNAIQRGDETIRIYTHMRKTPDDIKDIVRMYRGKDKVTGQRCLNRDLRGFGVADLTHHDFI